MKELRLRNKSTIKFLDDNSDNLKGFTPFLDSMIKLAIRLNPDMDRSKKLTCDQMLFRLLNYRRAHG